MVKEWLVKSLGGKCIVCSENDIRVLTIDHKNKDGGAHRRELKTEKNKAGAIFYRKLFRQIREYPEKQRALQLLCFNCHAKKDLAPWWTK